MATSIQVVIDCVDPAALGEFWAAALGYRVQEPPAGFATWQDFLAAQGIPEAEWNSANAVVDPEQRGPRIFFQRVPEPKTAKNRLHLDLNVGGGRQIPLAVRRERVDQEVVRLQHIGAGLVQPMDERDEYWVVMRDPEGNEFCVH